MSTDIFVVALAALTFVAVLIFALTSKGRVEQERHRTGGHPPSLARDGNARHKG